jgi:hypothetical protein
MGKCSKYTAKAEQRYSPLASYRVIPRMVLTISNTSGLLGPAASDAQPRPSRLSSPHRLLSPTNILPPRAAV